MGRIQLKNLSRKFGEHQVFHGVNLQLPENEKFWLQGENGSGKTTLLRLLNGSLYPSEGQVFIDKKNSRKHRAQVAKLVSLAPAQSDGFYPRLTGAENLKLFSRFWNISHDRFNIFINHWSQIPNFRKTLSTRFYESSTGMRQILNLALAFLASAPVLLLDEPFQGLDASTLDFIQSEISLCESTVIMASHNEKGVSEICPHRLEIKNAKVHWLEEKEKPLQFPLEADNGAKRQNWPLMRDL